MAAEMNDAFHAGDRFLDLREIGEVGGDKVIAGGEVCRLLDIARPKMRIDAAQNLAQSRADIAGRAGNENILHRLLQDSSPRHPCTFVRAGRCSRPFTRTAMLDNSEVTRRLARFVAETELDALPSPVVHQAKRALVNFFAVALTGCGEGAIEILLQSLATFSGGQQATVIGRGARLDALLAAFLNAASANVLDFCDTHVPTVIHPTAPVAPALFALGGLRRVSGRDLILAFVLGAEIECRIGIAISPSHYQRGWHITATCGVFGAAAASGKILALKTEPMVCALGLAATQAAGLCECLGTPAKSVHVGNAARNGLWSALLAAQGLTGPPEPLTGGQGYFHALAETPRLSTLTDGLGDSWEIMKTAFKPYPCGFVVHPVLDCVIDWPRAPTGRTFQRAANRK